MNRDDLVFYDEKPIREEDVMALLAMPNMQDAIYRVNNGSIKVAPAYAIEDEGNRVERLFTRKDVAILWSIMGEDSSLKDVATRLNRVAKL